MQKYYQTLGLAGNASIDDVKRAYRKKAKAYHPDVNQATNARDQFILVNEAYEMIIKSLTKPTTNKHQDSHTYQQWQEEARKRAAYYARKSYQDFKQSKNFRSANAIFNFFDVVFFITGTMIMLIPIVFADFSELELEPALAMGLLIVISFLFGLALAFLSLKSILERIKNNRPH